MNQSEWAKVKEIMWLTLEQPAGLREDFLKKECGDDSELIAEIKSLIEAGEESDQLLENENYSVSSVIEKSEKSDTEKTFGNYKIISELGRGGMGVVFYAMRADGEFTQKVALKVIRQSFADAELEKRFRRERQILASLNHPNIAALHDGGVSQRGEPFLVMEYVEGEPLLDYAETRELSIEDRLKLFLKICSAISYAHRNLIVHRDIKPNNIIVTKTGEPKLLDFGLAKILDENFDANATETAFRAFTPSYASPEQIHGKNITTASDVYSLGIVLYELLTGRNPFHFENKSFEEILSTVDHTEPARPSSVLRSSDRWSVVGGQRESKGSISESEGQTTKDEGQTKNPKSKIQNPKSLRGDLDNITLKALRKEPERRYKSVEEFAADIDRHLNDLPVSARPNNVSYLASRFFRRNKIVVSAVALVILALAGGLAVSLWQANEARKERDRAESRFQDVRKLSNSLLFELSPKIERLQGSTEVREILVTRALEYLDSLAREAGDDLHLQSELASAYEKVGDVQGKPEKANLGDLSGAVQSYEKARVIREKLAEQLPGDFETQKLLAANYKATGDIGYWSSNVADALGSYDHALTIYENLATEKTDDLDIQLDRVNTAIAKNKVISFNGNYPSAIGNYRQILVLLAALQNRFVGNPEIKRLTAYVTMRIGYDLSWENDIKAADEEVNKSLGIYEPLLAANPTDERLRRDVWYAYFQAAGIFVEADPPRARRYVEKSIVTVKDLSETDKLDFQAKYDLAQSYSKLGEINSYEKKFDESVENLNKAQIILNEISSAEPRHQGYKYASANNYARLAAGFWGKGDARAAIDNFEKAIHVHEELLATDKGDNMSVRAIAVAGQDLGNVYAKTNQRENALSAYRRSVEMFLRLREHNALSVYDEANLANSQKAVKNYQAK